MMEKQLFYWQKFDAIGDMVFHFSGITLKEDIGKFKKGDKLSSICIDYGNGILDIYNEDDTILVSFKLKLQVCNE